MPVRCVIRAGEYHDSVTLMQVAREVTQLAGVVDAAVVMATEANKAILSQAGLWEPELETATADDLVIVAQAESEATAQEALELAAVRLRQPRGDTRTDQAARPRSIHTAVRADPRSNLAIISVAGQYAAAEAWDALHRGLHVFLFSDNVSIDDEVALKEYAAERGLLMMGPGCGTAIINGVALGFANAVPRGPVGLVSAAGTGLQEVSSLLARQGVGVSQAIGTGGRDLHEAVGGRMMLAGLRALQDDHETQVVVLISKPPSAAVAERVLTEVAQGDKPTVICFLGSEGTPDTSPNAIPARTLQEAALAAAAAAQGHKDASVGELIERESVDLKAQAAAHKARLQPSQRYLRGLFNGGTLAAEALVVWADMGLGVWSNVALQERWKLRDTTHCAGHCALDLGEEEFTIGRPHPMIDNDLRMRRLMQEAQDPEAAVIMLDVVLGYGAHPDPAGELGPAIRQAGANAAAAGREILFVASVTGTREDPQGLERQARALRSAGVMVCDSNAAAAGLAGFLVRQSRGET